MFHWGCFEKLVFVQLHCNDSNILDPNLSLFLLNYLCFQKMDG